MDMPGRKPVGNNRVSELLPFLSVSAHVCPWPELLLIIVYLNRPKQVLPNMKVTSRMYMSRLILWGLQNLGLSCPENSCYAPQ